MSSTFTQQEVTLANQKRYTLKIPTEFTLPNGLHFENFSQQKDTVTASTFKLRKTSYLYSKPVSCLFFIDLVSHGGIQISKRSLQPTQIKKLLFKTFVIFFWRERGGFVLVDSDSESRSTNPIDSESETLPTTKKKLICQTLLACVSVSVLRFCVKEESIKHTTVQVLS
jgi:hypothetical protein